MTVILNDAKGYKGRKSAKGSGTLDFLFGELIVGTSSDNQIVLEIRQTLENGSSQAVGVMIPLGDLDKVIEGIKKEASQ